MSSHPPPAQGPQVFSLFDTPVIVDRLEDADVFNANLRELILARREADKGIEVSNLGGWHSARDMIEWGGEAARVLLKRIIAAADRFTVDIRAERGKPRYRWHPEMWANVSPPGASNQYHAHPGAFWSAIYYVDDGYAGSGDKALGGELVLMDPRMPAIRMNAPDLRFRRPGLSPDEEEKFMRPESGRIVLFPAWLSHAVRPYRGDGLRISIAVNLNAIALGIVS